MRWPGHRMASVSSRGVMIVRYRYGMPPMEAMSLSIAGILMLFWEWPGHRMAGVSFLQAGISIMEEAIQARKYGMQPMEVMPLSIAGIPTSFGQWPGRPMASASPRGAWIRQCRCGEPADGEHWHIDFRAIVHFLIYTTRSCNFSPLDNPLTGTSSSSEIVPPG